MIIIVIGIKDEKKWTYLKHQYKGHQLICIDDPGFLRVYSDHNNYQNEMFRQQIINISKQQGKSVLFTTYNTIIDMNLVSNEDTIHTCSKLNDLFHNFKIPYNVIKSYEMISDNYIEYNNDYIDVFNPVHIEYLKNILNILFNNVITSDNFKLDTTKQDILYMIPSIIKPHCSSIFTKDERLYQTMNQVKSVKEFNTNNKTILLELSDLETFTFSDIFRLSKDTTLLVLFGHNQRFREIARNTNKNQGEVQLLRFVLNKIKNQEFSHFYKFGGRYQLNNDYQDLYDNNYDAICKIMRADENPYRQDIIEPVIYSIKNEKITEFINVLDNMDNVLRNHLMDVERMLIELKYKMNVKIIDELKVGGYAATTGVYRNL